MVSNVTQNQAREMVRDHLTYDKEAQKVMMFLTFRQGAELFGTLGDGLLNLVDMAFDANTEKARASKDIHDLNWDAIRWEIDHGGIVVPNWSDGEMLVMDFYDAFNTLNLASVLSKLLRLELGVEESIKLDDGNQDFGFGSGPFREAKTGHTWSLFGLDEDSRHTPCVVCGHIFDPAKDEDFFQDMVDDRCVCNRVECVEVTHISD